MLTTPNYGVNNNNLLERVADFLLAMAKICIKDLEANTCALMRAARCLRPCTFLPVACWLVGLANLIASHCQFRILLQHQHLPDHGWSNLQIQSVLLLLATLDTNNKNNSTNSNVGADSSCNTFWVGVGECKGQCFSILVAN